MIGMMIGQQEVDRVEIDQVRIDYIRNLSMYEL